jgi:hypothetical protein
MKKRPLNHLLRQPLRQKMQPPMPSLHMMMPLLKPRRHLTPQCLRLSQHFVPKLPGLPRRSRMKQHLQPLRQLKNL